MDNLLKDTLQGQEPKVLQASMTESFVEFSSDRWNVEEVELQNKFAAMLANVHTEKKITKIEDDVERFAALSERQSSIEESRITSLELAQKKHNNKRDYLKDLFRFFYATKSLKFPLESYSGGKESVPCVFLGFQIDLRKTNPYAPSSVILRFAIANGAKYIAIPASYSEVVYSIMGASGRTSQPESITILLSEWETACQGNSVDRKVRHIITGNLLQAFGRFKGKLVSYTTLEGGVKKGILMPENWDASKEVADKVVVPVTKGASIIKSLTNGHITTNNGVGFVRFGVDFKIIVPLSRKTGGAVYLDKDLLALVRNELFEKSGDKMVAKLDIAQFDEFINVLQRNHKSTIVIQSYQLAQLSKDVAPGATYKIKAPGAAPNELLLEQMEIDEMEIEALALMLELELLDLDPVELAGIPIDKIEALAVRLDYELMQMA